MVFHLNRRLFRCDSIAFYILNFSFQTAYDHCKFHQNVPMQLSELHQLKEKAAVVPWGNANRDEYFALFCISGYSEDLQQLAQEDSHLLLM